MIVEIAIESVKPEAAVLGARCGMQRAGRENEKSNPPMHVNAYDTFGHMLLDVNTRLISGIAILDVAGHVSAGAEADSLRNHLIEAFRQSSKYILLNCEELSYADSSALGELMNAYSTIVRGGGMLKLLRPHKRVRQLLQITHLDRVFEVLEDEGRAVASFNSASVARGQQSLKAFLQDS